MDYTLKSKSVRNRHKTESNLMTEEVDGLKAVWSNCWNSETRKTGSW